MGRYVYCILYIYSQDEWKESPEKKSFYFCLSFDERMSKKFSLSRMYLYSVYMWFHLVYIYLDIAINPSERKSHGEKSLKKICRMHVHVSNNLIFFLRFNSSNKSFFLGFAPSQRIPEIMMSFWNIAWNLSDSLDGLILFLCSRSRLYPLEFNSSL